MKTAMTEMKEFIEQQIYYGNLNAAQTITANMLLGKSVVLLQKEQEQIEDAYDAGNDALVDWDCELTYYKETYNK